MYFSPSRSKIMRPNLPSSVLHREALVVQLREALIGSSSATGIASRYKLLLLCAPAGYGKTTLLVDFAQHTDIPCCWYFLDRTDTDKIMFLELLLASIRERFPFFGETLNAILIQTRSASANNPTDLHACEAFIDALLVAIATEIPQRFALMLCNYQEINVSPSVNTLVNRFLHHIPPQCLLVIESRAIPALDFTPFVARHEMFGLGSNGLQFTAQEIIALARLQGRELLAEEDAQLLANSFDGWITGILLGTRLGNVQMLQDNTLPSSWGSPALRMGRQNLLTYIVNEVFAHDQEVYTFLKDTSILDQMTPTLCTALLDISDAASRLVDLERQGFFVTLYSETPEMTYTCHPLLRELLRDELQKQDPLRFSLLHRRAAIFFRTLHDYDHAISHALAASVDDAAVFIQEISTSMLAQGRWEMLARWIDMLPSTTMECYPQLLLARAEIYLMLSQYTLALPLLEQVNKATTNQLSGEGRTLQAALLIARSSACFQSGDYSQAQSLSQEALALLPADEVQLRGKAYLRLGVCANMEGNVTAGIAQLQHALHLWGQNTEIHQTASLHDMLANAYDMVGNYALSEHHRARALRCYEHLGNEVGKVNSLIGMGVTKQRQGAFPEAEAAFQQALTLARESLGFQRGEAYALVSLGDLYLDQDLYTQALAAIEDGLTLARRLGDRYLTEYSLCTLAMTYLLMGDAQTALLFVSQTGTKQKNTETPSYEKVMRELTQGAIFLHEQRYKEALICLTSLETFLRKAGLKREQLQATIRMAACHLAQGNTTRLIRCMEKAAMLTMQGAYDSLALLELRRLPNLLQAIKNMPETAPVRSLLNSGGNLAEGDPVPLQKSTSSLSMKRHSHLQVFALGEPKVLVDDIPITRWRMARAMELYFLLLDRSQLRKEQIIVALWPDADDSIDQTLRSMIYYLRRAVGESSLVYRAGMYTLNLATLYGEDVHYDVATFSSHEATANQALMAGDEQVAREAFRDMVEIYRGDYVQSFYSDWCISRRDEVRRSYMKARQHLARLAWDDEDLDESAMHWQHMLAVDPCQEEAHYGLMRYYTRRGKREMALRQYHRCATTLQEELSATPGSALQKLYQRLSGNKTSSPP